MAGTVGQGGPDEKRREIPYLGAVKVAAVVMGIMIVVGVAVIGVTIAKRLSGAGDEVTAVVPAAAPAIPFGERALALPKGAKVTALALESGRLAVALNLAEGGTAILMIDAATGQRLGLIRLTEAEQ